MTRLLCVETHINLNLERAYTYIYIIKSKVARGLVGPAFLTVFCCRNSEKCLKPGFAHM